jgi:hypothetical protein
MLCRPLLISLMTTKARLGRLKKNRWGSVHGLSLRHV